MIPIFLSVWMAIWGSLLSRPFIPLSLFLSWTPDPWKLNSCPCWGHAVPDSALKHEIMIILMVVQVQRHILHLAYRRQGNVPLAVIPSHLITVFSASKSGMEKKDFLSFRRVL